MIFFNINLLGVKEEEMDSLNLLIKPISSDCNLKCEYCFYNDVSNNRKIKNYGIMSETTLENIVKKIFNEVRRVVNFTFQGGEPLLVGLYFFNKFHKFIKKYNKNNVLINFYIQTNATLIDENWIKFFKKYNYLVGVSLDGNKDIHNRFRIDRKGKGSFTLVLKNIKLLRKNNIEFNILCVVSKPVVKNARIIYRFFRNNRFKFYQFIPCIDSLNDLTKKSYTIDSEEYGRFLNDIFELWYNDITSNKKISIRYFDNIIKIILNEQIECCDMTGHCNINMVIESDGSIYPCDFYVLDNYKIGDINKMSYSEIISSNVARDFINDSLNIDNKCIQCKFVKLCRGGCKRYKNADLQNKFCESYLEFFNKNMVKLFEIAYYIKKNR